MKTNWLLYFYFLFLFLGIGNTLHASAPDWAVDTKAFQGTMTVTGMIEINGLKSRKTDDIVAVFVRNECRGIAKPIYNKALDRYFVFLSIFGNETLDTLTYKIYIAGEDRVYSGREKIVYDLNATLGKIDLPYLFRSASATGVESILALKAFQIYPNPLSGDELTVSLQLKSLETELQLTLSDILGRVIHWEKINNGNTEYIRKINSTGWKPGFYLVSLSDGNGVVCRKMIRY